MNNAINVVTSESDQTMQNLRKENSEHLIEKVGSKLRGMMTWLPSKQKNEVAA